MKFSVVMSTYNCDEYLHISIDSILNQTYDDFEFIIIDDGSKDNTEKIVSGYKDPRIKFVRNQKNRGLGYSLNRGISLAKYDYIARMDADDISHSDRFRNQIDKLVEEPNIDWISSWYSNFSTKPIDVIKLPEYSTEIRNNLVLSNSVCFGGSIFKKNIIIENGGFSNTRFEDYEFLLKVKDDCNFYNIQEVLYYQRKRKDSLSRSNFEESKKVIYHIQQKYYKDLSKEFSISKSEDQYFYKGWREFLFGDKVLARNYWIKIGMKIFYYPKAILGVLITFSPQNMFVILKKIGFKIMLFYRPFVSSKVKKDFKKIVKCIRNESFTEN